MKTVIIKSIIFTFISFILVFLFREIFHSDSFLSDVGGLSAFVTVFGTLYGIMAAFVVFEVWGQFTKTSSLIDQEALGLERLYRLTIYFRDKNLTGKMKQAIDRYIRLVMTRKFQHLGLGKQDAQLGQAFRNISAIIRDISFDDDHDQIVFDHVVNHYGELSSIRKDRINQSLLRLPYLLRFFLYFSSGVALVTFIVMPYGNLLYGLYVGGSLTFIITMMLQLVEDLDNPFVGYWKISPDPYQRVLDHIEKDYD